MKKLKIILILVIAFLCVLWILPTYRQSKISDNDLSVLSNFPWNDPTALQSVGFEKVKPDYYRLDYGEEGDIVRVSFEEQADAENISFEIGEMPYDENPFSFWFCANPQVQRTLHGEYKNVSIIAHEIQNTYRKDEMRLIRLLKEKYYSVS